MDDYLIALALIVLSALFSGLTLGYFTLNKHDLKRQANRGHKNAKKIYPLRRRGNHLLTTLLLGNVLVNTTLSIYLGSIANGVVAVILATGLIVIFGEILPQAIIARNALWFGALAAPFVRFVMFILSPVVYPIAYALDKALGHETPRTFSKHELMDIVSEHEDSDHSPIDEDEERIVHGALQFSHTKVREIMTNIDVVVMFDENQKLNESFFREITHAGFSRYPVYSGKKTNIIGLLYAKDLLTEDNEISIKETEDAFEDEFMIARPGEHLDTILARMLKQKRHMAVVKTRNNVCIGVVTLEDIIEEIIQQEIEDEDDADNEDS